MATVSPYRSSFSAHTDLCICSTTDHISAAGPWLKYKGHLTNLAENTCKWT
jgi:hypothetical protein